MKERTSLFPLLLLLLLSLQPAHAQKAYIPGEANLGARKEFQDNKFGIFLHWGLYSLIGDTEWVMTNKNIHYQEYPKLAKAFYPSQFDAKEWVSLIKSAGAKYITITTRHHDGFSLFRTKQSPYNIVDATPFHRDVIAELAEACREQGIKLHFYYSHLDWGREDYPVGRTGQGVGRPKEKEDWKSYYTFMNNQLTELLTQYGPVGAIWFDGLWDHDQDTPPFDWQLDEQYALIHRLQPACLIGNNHHQKPFPGEDIQMFERDLPGENNAGLSGQEISRLPLEMCQTMNHHWGYSIADQDYKSPKELIHLLVKAAGRNTNLLLNIGPEPGGNLPQKAVERLKAIGEWMSAYAETIYGTRGGPVSPRDWGVTTQKGNKLFVHILNLPDASLYLPVSAKRVKSAKVFADGARVSFVKSGEGVTLNLPKVPTEIDYVVEVELKK